MVSRHRFPAPISGMFNIFQSPNPLPRQRRALAMRFDIPENSSCTLLNGGERIDQRIEVFLGIRPDRGAHILRHQLTPSRLRFLEMSVTLSALSYQALKWLCDANGNLRIMLTELFSRQWYCQKHHNSMATISSITFLVIHAHILHSTCLF